jgi:hypothetical protein
MDLSPHPSFSERRARRRLALCVPAHILLPEPIGAVKVVTQNLSIAGFYSVCEEFFRCGDEFDCILEVSGIPQSNAVHLECRVRVVRVVAVHDTRPDAPDYSRNDAPNRFGVAFRIESYRVETRTLE